MRDMSHYPRSLKAAAAIDQLARDLYVNRQHYSGEPVSEWTDLPGHIRAGLFEVAAQTLKQIAADAPQGTDNPLMLLTADLTRAEQRRVARRVVLDFTTPNGSAA